MMVPGSDQLGLYISIPFCRSKCTYCNFASGVFPAHEHARYMQRLIDEMHGARKGSNDRGASLPTHVDTIYLGGGTPSLLEPDLIHRLFSAIGSSFTIDPDAEITVECAPGQLADPTLLALAEVGANRVSLGVQSFVDREARQSGRLHTRDMVLDEIRRLRKAGITNLNVDLIAGLAGQTFTSWQESLAVLIGTGVPHASVYMLEIDDESRLGRELLAGGARYHADLVPSDDTIARMYECAIDMLGDAGFAQYEISNFAHPGYESRHNLRYWQRRPYLGIGLDASSMLHESASSSDRRQGDHVLRFTTADDLEDYIEARNPPEIAWLSPERQQEEAWFLGLRLNRGVCVSALREEFGNQTVAPAIETVEQLAARGLVAYEGDVVCLTAKGRLLSNEVFQEFLGSAAPELAAG